VVLSVVATPEKKVPWTHPEFARRQSNRPQSRAVDKKNEIKRETEGPIHFTLHFLYAFHLIFAMKQMMTAQSIQAEAVHMPNPLAIPDILDLVGSYLSPRSITSFVCVSRFLAPSSPSSYLVTSQTCPWVRTQREVWSVLLRH